MPLAPTNPVGSPRIMRFSVPVAAVGTAGNDLTTPLCTIARKGYLSAARYLPGAALSGANTNSRTFTVIDPTTRSIADGNIVAAAATSFQGSWLAATAYTAGQTVIYNNLLWVNISAVTGGNGPGNDATHWVLCAAMGLNVVNSITANFSADDVGKAISDSGNTNIPASSFIGSVIVQPGVTAALLVNSAGASVNGTAVIGRTVTIGSSRTLATLAQVSGVNLAAGVETDLTLSTTDTTVYAGDVLELVSTHVGTGITDPGGTFQVEVTQYGE